MELIVENLTKTYSNKVKALDNVNLRIGVGMFGLLGPNGAGKSTLMRTIATIQSPDEGYPRILITVPVQQPPNAFAAAIHAPVS